MKVRITNPARGALMAMADVAESPESKRLGLLGRMNFIPGDGLWISPCDSIHTFGMQFPIDVLFLGPNSDVLDFAQNMAPGGSVVRDGAASVLELPAGAIEGTGTQIGDALVFAALESPGQGVSIPGCLGLLNLAEQYGLVQPGTSVAISQLVDHAQKIKAGFQGVRG